MTVIREKGKIPRTEWPRIVALYGNGASIAEIGRRYGCTAPAIRYIIKRNGKLRSGAGAGATPHRGTGTTSARGMGATSMPSRDPGPPRLDSSAGLAPADILGPSLRRRLSSAIASFLASLDQAVVSGSHKSLLDLVEATDILMRSAARTRIEIERRLAGKAPDAEGDTLDSAATRASTQNG